ncbi:MULTISPECIES: hypothetical protein [Candidatus Nitrosocaldus]|jgi:hypothetical protein|uniref:Metallopeptidase n=1 Tax=Candidatus Nitrosocaldus cavascurensis TaxID=2058097 RepID=A0A2K5AQP3_9ARCH|nr:MULTISPECIES: hypothetical protein [Candidatus Nitrosocaldus]SPC33919.1 conserved protein of unknown function [Candidatus Nitrosocaldus cavascurensis]
MSKYRERLRVADDFKDVFAIVKDAVEDRFGMRRAGLNLLLQDMPSFIGAYHVLGSNSIVINRYLLNAVKSIARSKEEYNSYIFVVLTHEYLHSLGVVDEYKVRTMTYGLCRDLLGDEHTATIMAKGDPMSYFPELRMLTRLAFGREYEVVKEFDTSNLSYIA